jgi:hypothetical protein
MRTETSAVLGYPFIPNLCFGDKEPVVFALTTHYVSWFRALAQKKNLQFTRYDLLSVNQ